VPHFASPPRGVRRAYGSGQYPLPPADVRFAVEDPLPRAKGPGEQSETIKPAAGHRYHHGCAWWRIICRFRWASAFLLLRSGRRLA
jgi:hypothetical protein